MSQENVELVRSVYEAWTRDELPGPSEAFDPKIEYVNPPSAVEPGTRRGLAAFAQAVRDMFSGWETWEIEPERFVSSAEKVSVTECTGVKAGWMSPRTSRRFGQSEMARSFATSGFTGQTTRSMPLGCRSRRCRRRRWNWHAKS